MHEEENNNHSPQFAVAEEAGDPDDKLTYSLTSDEVFSISIYPGAGEINVLRPRQRRTRTRTWSTPANQIARV
jgi:hypothetical protein